MGSLEDAAHFVEVVAGVQQHRDPQPVAAPLFDFVEVAAVSIVRVIGFLCELVECERSVGALVDAVGLTQSALSQHLAKLRAAGIVATRRDAQTIYYRLASAAATSVMKTLADIYCGGKPRKVRTAKHHIRTS